LDIKCPLLKKYPDVVVIVATIRAIRLHSTNGVNELKSLESGFANLQRHIQNIKRYNLPVVVALNTFSSDTKEEIEYLKQCCEEVSVKIAISNVWEFGAKGGVGLASSVLEAISSEHENFNPLYEQNDLVFDKVRKLVCNIYGAAEVSYSKKAFDTLKKAENASEAKLYPICMAKTQYSLSDNKNLLGAPKNFTITIKDAQIMSGARFIVTYAGDVVTMPGLPKRPAAEIVNIVDGKISGLF
jgi:formate--tetrahydrofolate ligase